MKRFILIALIIVTACIITNRIDENKMQYREYTWAMDLTVDRCTIDMINNNSIECD